VTDFVVTAAQEAAERAGEQAHVIRLSLERAFIEAILNPPEPTARRRAFRHHREDSRQTNRSQLQSCDDHPLIRC